MIYEIKISLENLPLPVTRTFHIPSDAAFYDLHEMIIASFNWEDIHPHVFEVMKSDGELVQGKVILSFLELFKEEDEEIDVETLKQRKDPDSTYEDDVLLEDYFKKVGDTIHYKYDGPDFWTHLITLQQVVHSNDDLEVPVCVDAENDAPEEHTQNQIHNFDETLRNDDSPALIKEINSMIELAFEEEPWDGEVGNELESLVDDVVTQVFKELESFPDEPDESQPNK
ncbi:plasmid pRiA4b ORF-3 family protein [Atopococcus tabaci]|uniref:plasmid pRiA4b ORF-3 family protein n=1 Tax=Atopococcus tabaci TaxID=269774 RepID=UPI00040BBAF2|nr:plasmid pRiA4b ORF-3 family protein [Atopococcus tabaci]